MSAIELVAQDGGQSLVDIAQAFDCIDADLLVLCTISGGATGVNAADFNGVAFDKVFSHTENYNFSDPDVELAFWTLQNPDQGSFTLNIDGDGNPAGGGRVFMWYLFALKNTNSTSPVAGTDYSSEQHSGSAPSIDLEIVTTATSSFAATIGTVYFNGPGYHEPPSDMVEVLDATKIGTNNNGGVYCAYGIFSGAGTIQIGGHDNFIASLNASKQIEAAILINGTGAAAAGSFFLVL